MHGADLSVSGSDRFKKSVEFRVEGFLDFSEIDRDVFAVTVNQDPDTAEIIVTDLKILIKTAVTQGACADEKLLMITGISDVCRLVFGYGETIGAFLVEKYEFITADRTGDKTLAVCFKPVLAGQCGKGIRKGRGITGSRRIREGYR